MNEDSKRYIENSKIDDQKIVRTELILTPLLVIAPFLIGYFLINDWYIRDYIGNELDLFKELILGCIIIVGNILFDIPFIGSLVGYRKSIKK